MNHYSSLDVSTFPHKHEATHKSSDSNDVWNTVLKYCEVIRTKAVAWRCSAKKVSEKFLKIHRKTPVSESLC